MKASRRRDAAGRQVIRAGEDLRGYAARVTVPERPAGRWPSRAGHVAGYTGGRLARASRILLIGMGAIRHTSLIGLPGIAPLRSYAGR